MPRLIETRARTEVLMAAVNDLLHHEGVRSLSLRRIARASGISTSSMLHHYGTQEHLFRVVAARTGRARVTDISQRLYFEKVSAFLPDTPEQLALATAWQAWIQLARAESAWQRGVDEMLDKERGLLALELELPYHDDRVAAVSALVEGLVGAMSRPLRPLAAEHARRVFEATVAALLA
jgi:AcrR family transcriptional regulator